MTKEKRLKQIADEIRVRHKQIVEGQLKRLDLIDQAKQTLSPEDFDKFMEEIKD